MDDAVSQLGAAAGVKIVLDQAWLPTWDAGNSVDLHLRDVELGAALDRLNSAWFPMRTVERRGDELHVVLIDRMPSTVRVYDITDIIERWLAMPHVKQQWEDDGKLGGSLFGAPAPSLTRDELTTVVVDAIEKSVYPAIWKVPPASGTITALGTRIVVVCPGPVHCSVDAFLGGLRESAPDRPGN